MPFDQHVRDHCIFGAMPHRDAIAKLKRLNDEREEFWAKERVYRFLTSS